jgi:hypothetical protein
MAQQISLNFTSGQWQRVLATFPGGRAEAVAQAEEMYRERVRAMGLADERDKGIRKAHLDLLADGF